MSGSTVLQAREVTVQAREVTVRYNGSPVVDCVSLDADGGTVIGLIGPNGAGKTTLIKALSGLLPISDGTIALNGKALKSWSREALAREVGYLSQSRIVHWPVTVERLVSLGRLPHRGPWDRLAEEDAAAVESALEATDVISIRNRTVTTLSGGELARVLLARVLAGEPRVLLADEPVSGLDPGHRLQVLEGLRTLARQGRLVVVVMHDLTLASRYCDRLVLLDQGKVIADGAADEVLAPDRLSSVYGVEALTVSHNGENAILPWTSIAT